MAEDISSGTFYAGGFFYNPRARKVLLHKRDTKTKNSPNQWAFFGGLREGEEPPVQTFAREIKEELGIEFPLQSIHPLCDYFNPDFDTHRYVFYVVTEAPKSAMTLTEGEDFDWLPLEEAFNLDLTKRTRQDLTTFLVKLEKHVRASVES